MLERWGPSLRTVAIVNQKGGCGKTTTAISLAGVYASRGMRVLLVDLDPQSHCAAGLGIPERRIELDITDAMVAADGHGIDPAKLIWKPSRNLDLIPSRMKLAGLEASRGGLAERSDRQRRLALVLGKLAADYDICLIDCSPAIGLLTYNALAASSVALIPVETSFFSLQGASKQMTTVKTVARQMELSIRSWLVATIHDTESGLAGDLFEELCKRFGDSVCPHPVRRDGRLKEAASIGKTIVQYAPESTGAEDYAVVAEWLKARLSLKPAEGTEPRKDALEEPHVQDHTEDGGMIRVVGAVETGGLTQRLAGRSGPSADGHSHAPPPPSRRSDLEAKPEEPPPAVTIAEQIALDLRSRAATRAEEMARLAQKLAGRTHAPPAATVEAKAEAPGTGVLTLVPEARTAAPRPVPGLPLGVKETSQGMLFVQPLAMGNRVAIAADFNAWSTDRHVMKRNDELGVFELCVALPPGRYSYRLVVDGRWQSDPFNPATDPNPFGEPNNVLVVTTARMGTGESRQAT